MRWPAASSTRLAARVAAGRLAAWVGAGMLAWAVPDTRAASAPAGAPLASTSVDLDADGAPERVLIDVDGALRVVDSTGAERGRVAPPEGPRPGRAAGAERGRVAPPEGPRPGRAAGAIAIVHSGDRTYVHARIPLEDARAIEEVGLWVGGALRPVASLVTGPQGPDGERRPALRVDEQGVLLFQRAPAIRRCDGFDVLFPELYDAGTGRFRPVEIAPPEGAALPRAVPLPAAARAAPLGLFRFHAASTQRGDERRADRLAPPREVDDGRTETAWYEGATGSGRGAFLSARSLAGPVALRGIAVTAAPGNRITHLTLLLDEQEPLAVALPPVEAGRPLWIPLPGRAASCISLALDGIERRGARDETGIAEVAIHAATDGPGALAHLIERVGSGGDEGAALLPLLAEHAREVAAALPAATPAGRRLLLRALAASREAAAAGPLVAALASAPAADHPLIAAALAPGRPLAAPARDALAAMLVDRRVPEAARRSALSLVVAGPGGPGRVVRALADGALELPALRRAAVQALGGANIEETVAALAADAGARVAATDRLSILGAVAGRARAGAADALRRRMVDLLQAAAPDPGNALDDASFLVHLAWVRAAGLAASERLLPALESESAASDEVLRAAAVTAAAGIEGGLGRAIARRAAGDPSPLVRAAAIAGQAAAGDPELPASATALLADPWPMVRREAAERLALRCPAPAGEALVRATGDGDEGVAAAAMTALAACDRERAGPLALDLARDARVRPGVRERAAALAARLHPAGAAAALSEALLDVLDDPRSDERVAGLAASLARALGRLGDAAGEGALLRALDEPSLSGLRAEAAVALARLCTPAARRALRAAGTDDDSAVRRAAAHATTRCPDR